MPRVIVTGSRRWPASRAAEIESALAALPGWPGEWVVVRSPAGPRRAPARWPTARRHLPTRPPNKIAALLDARARHGGRTLIAEDLAREAIPYNRIVTGAAVLGISQIEVSRINKRCLEALRLALTP